MARKRGARRSGPKKTTREEPGLMADIGELVDVFCSTCRLNLDGSVTALNGAGHVVQITCRTCGNVQKFRPPMADEEQRERLLRKAFAIRDRRGQQTLEAQAEKGKAYSTNELMARWRAATADADHRAPIYRETEVYEVGDFLIHNQHGLGVAQEVLHEHAVLVLFRETEVPVEMGKVYDD